MGAVQQHRLLRDDRCLRRRLGARGSVGDRGASVGGRQRGGQFARTLASMFALSLLLLIASLVTFLIEVRVAVRAIQIRDELLGNPALEGYIGGLWQDFRAWLEAHHETETELLVEGIVREDKSVLELLEGEARRRGVTLALLWEEYRGLHPDGYGYSRYCELYRAWAVRLSPTMRQSHVAGERMFVDYAENGSYQEETLHANRRDFEAIKFEQLELY